MLRILRFGLCGLVVWLAPALSTGDENPQAIDSLPPPTRNEMKRVLEALQLRSPRLPLTPPTDQQGTRRRGSVYNGRARALFLPATWYAADFKSDPSMTVDSVLKVKAFWVVSRANDCHY